MLNRTGPRLAFIATLFLLGTSCAPQSPLLIEAAPSRLLARGSGGSLEVTWSHPDALDPRIHHVDVAWRYADDDAWSDVERVAVDTTTVTIEGLEDYRPLEVRAAYARSTTQGPWAEAPGPITATTPPTTPPEDAWPALGGAVLLTETEAVPLATCARDATFVVDLDDASACAPMTLRTSLAPDAHGELRFSVDPPLGPNFDKIFVPADRPLLFEPIDISGVDERVPAWEIWDLGRGDPFLTAVHPPARQRSGHLESTAFMVSPSDAGTRKLLLRSEHLVIALPIELLPPSTERYVYGVDVSPTSLTLSVGNEATIIATTRAINPPAGGVEWFSLDPRVATVDDQGHVTAIRPGRTNVIARSTFTPSREAVVPVLVRQAPRVTIDPPPTSYLLGGTSVDLTARVDAWRGARSDVTWASSDPSVATISSEGRATAIEPGTVTLRATSVESARAFDEVTLRVPEPGETLWTVQFGTPQEDGATSLAVDGDAHAYVTAVENSLLLGTVGVSTSDGVVMRIDPNGSVDWRYVTQSETDGGYFVEHLLSDVIVDPEGNLVVAANVALLPFLQNITVPYLFELTLEGGEQGVTRPGSSSMVSYLGGLSQQRDGTVISAGISRLGNAVPLGLYWATDMDAEIDDGNVTIVSLADADVQFRRVATLSNDTSLAVGSIDVDSDALPARPLGVLLDANHAVSTSGIGPYWTLSTPTMLGSTEDASAEDVTVLDTGSIAIVGTSDDGNGASVGFGTLLDPLTLSSVDTHAIIAESAGNVRAAAVATTPEGDLVVAGTTTGPLQPDHVLNGAAGFVTVFRVDAGATLEPLMTWLVDGPGEDFIVDVEVTRDGVILVAGHTQGSLGGSANRGGRDAFVRALAP